MTLFPPETAGNQVSRIYTYSLCIPRQIYCKGGPVNIQAVSFLGDTGENIFQVRHGENLKKFSAVCNVLWTVGFEPTTQKTHGLSTTPLVMNLWGISPFDHWQKR